MYLYIWYLVECKENNFDRIRLLMTNVAVHISVFREVFWHVNAKIPRHTGQNAITGGDLECILTQLL